ncbi:hypothetical protein QG37_00842 [Candidozyma auris]|uniref:Uncharacterized protein n=1 Tax=Candidozyma auris TaxID=498019 RepID=A0A0L0P763_CANAR|nr:hypothetical protein QG37_00842 [[Candida] auris]
MCQIYFCPTVGAFVKRTAITTGEFGIGDMARCRGWGHVQPLQQVPLGTISSFKQERKKDNEECEVCDQSWMLLWHENLCITLA